MIMQEEKLTGPPPWPVCSLTPVLADTTIYKTTFKSSDGYLTAGDKLFSQALENSRNRTDSSKDAVKLSMWGTHNDSDKDGLTELKLSDKTYDNVNYILFADNSSRTTPFIAQVSVLIKRI